MLLNETIKSKKIKNIKQDQVYCIPRPFYQVI